MAFTHSSNLVGALDAAVRQTDWPKKLGEVAAISARLRPRLRSMGFRLVASDADATPGVVTIALPPGQSSTQLGQKLHEAGFLLSYGSDYLRHRNWIQICLMGDYSAGKLEELTDWLAKNAVPQPACSSAQMTLAG